MQLKSRRGLPTWAAVAESAHLHRHCRSDQGCMAATPCCSCMLERHGGLSYAVLCTCLSAGQTPEIVPGQPGWNPNLASDSEAAVSGCARPQGLEVMLFAVQGLGGVLCAYCSCMSSCGNTGLPVRGDELRLYSSWTQLLDSQCCYLHMGL